MTENYEIVNLKMKTIETSTLQSFQPMIML